MRTVSHKLVEILNFPFICHTWEAFQRNTVLKTILEGLMCFDFCDTIQALLVKREGRTSVSVKNQKKKKKKKKHKILV